MIPHSRYQEANFCHELYDLVKIAVLIVFSIAENMVGLPGSPLKICITKNQSQNFRFPIKDSRYCCDKPIIIKQ